MMQMLMMFYYALKMESVNPRQLEEEEDLDLVLKILSTISNRRKR